MAITKLAKKSKNTKGKSTRPSFRSSGSGAKSSHKAPEGISKRKQKSLSLAKPGHAQKSKSLTTKASANKRKERVYSEKELDIPKLNGIIPAGIAKPKGLKKGKKFVDDSESMMAIMSIVNSEKEGRLESKIMRARQLEEIREAKRREAEARSEDKRAQFEQRKQDLKKKKRKRSSDPAQSEDAENEPLEKNGKFKLRKKVSFQ